jgi:hypothetical protein
MQLHVMELIKDYRTSSSSSFSLACVCTAPGEKEGGREENKGSSNKNRDTIYQTQTVFIPLSIVCRTIFIIALQI